MVDPRAEAQEKLAKAGFKINGNGSIELSDDAPMTAEDLAAAGGDPATRVADPATPVPDPKEPLPPAPTPDPQKPIKQPPVDAPPAPPVPPANPQNHDWEKREKDAKEAQRNLSRLELELKRRSDEIDARMAKLDAREREMDERFAKLTAPAKPSKEAMDALLQEYPSLAEGVRAMITEALETDPRLTKVSKIEQDLGRFDEFTTEATRGSRLAQVINAVVQLHPDAVQIAQGDEGFRDWLDTLPVRMRDDYTRAVFTHSADYEPEYIAHIIGSYKAIKQTPTPQPPAPATPPTPPRAPSVSPALAGPGARTQAVGPLSEEERANFGELMRKAPDAAARRVLRERLEATYPSN